MNRILFLILVTILPSAAVTQAAKQTATRRSAVEPGHTAQINRGDLVGNMQLLNLWGDRHGARVFRIPRPSGYSFYEFEPGESGWSWRWPGRY